MVGGGGGRVVRWFGGRCDLWIPMSHVDFKRVVPVTCDMQPCRMSITE